MYNCSFPTHFFLLDLSTFLLPLGHKEFLDFFFFLIKDPTSEGPLKTQQLKPTSEKSASLDAKATLLQFLITCTNESPRPGKEKYRCGLLVCFSFA